MERLFFVNLDGHGSILGGAHIFVEFFVKGNGCYHMPVTKMAAPYCLGARWQRGIGQVLLAKLIFVLLIYN